YQKKKESLTEIKEEPWHFRYVGKKIAKKLYDEKISLEEYYAKYGDK
ncbi:MAG: D-alanyl-D-alanine carboxypeptidase family protein, partial [Bacilli bacterium]|nr:D-alanyl-D-alanine carboxypeptidase family protein [Bacilli bacterium]